MKKIFYCLPLLILTGSLTTIAQTTIIKLNSIKDADSIASIQYAYSGFRDGRVFFLNKGITPAKLNYSRVKGEILFKDASGVLALNKLETVEKVTIANDTFLVSPVGGFVKQIRSFPTVTLVKKSELKFLDRERKVAYGGYSSAAGTRSVTTLPGIDQSNLRVGVDENLSYSLTDTYYLLTPAKRLVQATEKALLLAYPNNKKDLKAYIYSNRVNFNNPDDLSKLLQFAQSFN